MNTTTSPRTRSRLNSLACVNVRYEVYGQTAQQNLTVRKRVPSGRGKDQIRYLRCEVWRGVQRAQGAPETDGVVEHESKRSQSGGRGRTPDGGVFVEGNRTLGAGRCQHGTALASTVGRASNKGKRSHDLVRVAPLPRNSNRLPDTIRQPVCQPHFYPHSASCRPLLHLELVHHPQHKVHTSGRFVGDKADEGIAAWLQVRGEIAVAPGVNPGETA